MTRRKSVCIKWTLVISLVLVYPSVYTRPQETFESTSNSGQSDISAQTSISPFPGKVATSSPVQPIQYANPAPESSGRDVKSKAPIRQSIEMVAIQLLDKPNSTVETPILAVSDTRIPPKLKTQVKHRIKTRNEDGEQLENAHRGEAVLVTMEELETENKISEVVNESSTSNAGISTWGSLGNSVKENTTTESSKVEDASKKYKPTKNKPKRPQNNKGSKRPIIGSTNKSDLVAGGSAINENVYNQIKDTVLSNVQKNKNTRPSTTSTTPLTTTTTTESPTTKPEIKTPVIPVVTITSKPKKKNKNKSKTSTTTITPMIDDSALLPTEAKEQEIELEISTPATTTKKPKRSSTRKKNKKNKKRKTSTTKPSTEVAVSDVKTSNKTKSNKHTKKPAVEASALTTQIYNYLSREVMPSVGVGVLGLASLVGLAGYFLYPFATPVRRTFEVDKNDDLYRNNAEEYANDGNGQAEEEMLGTVLAGMPAHAKQKLNPYAAQTSYVTRYPVKKEQDIRYKHVTPAYNPSYKVHYAQQKTGIAHAAVYSKPFAYSPQQYETRHAYTTEGKYHYDNNKHPNYTPYSAAVVEPIYAAPQTGPSSVSSYDSDNSNSVVYGVKPSAESDFKPVYPYEGQYLSETTSSSVTYSPTSMYLGSNDNSDKQYDEDTKYEDSSNDNLEGKNNKFVVGNVPKELSDSATPAVVPEHGPRKLRKKRSISESLEELLAEKELNKDIFLNNEIDGGYHSPIRNLAPIEQNDVNVIPKEMTTVYAISEPVKDTKTTETSTIDKVEVVESVSTIPISTKDEKTTESEMPVELETTTKSFKVYEVFPSSYTEDERNSPLTQTTIYKSIMTETTTELKSETTSVMPTAEISTVSTVKPTVSTDQPTISTSTSNPDVITYPPLNDGGFFTFIQRLIDFKFRLGLGILQSTVDALNRFKNDTMQKVVKASQT